MSANDLKKIDMKIKNILSIIAVILMAVGCTSDDGSQQAGRVPIRLSATVESSKVSHTRAGTTGSTTQDTELLDGQTVAAYIKEKDGDWIANPLACTVSGTDGDLTYSGNYNYPMDGTPVTIYAVHPSIASAATFTVSADQTTDDNYAASDLCYCKSADKNRQEAAHTLTFSHVMSKIIVNVDVSGLGITPAPAVTNLKLKAKTQATITYPTGSDSDYSLSEASTPGYIALTPGAAAIIPPQTTAAAGDVRIAFDVAGIGPIAYDFPAGTEFTPNTQYTFTVKVGTTITVTSSINPWGGSDTPENTYTGYATPTEPKYMKNPLWYVAEYNINSDLTFNTTNSTSQGYLFQWDSGTYPAMNIGFTANTTGYDGYLLPSPAKTVSNGELGATWHMPTVMEWLSIIPAVYVSSSNYAHVFGTQISAGTVVNDPPCTFGYNNDTKYSNGTDNTSNMGIVYQSYWSSYTAGSHVRYAIRFLGTDYCSVWKYEYADYGSSSTTSRLVISSRLINPIAATNTTALADMMTTITNGSYDWSENETIGAIQRTFYTVGYAASSVGNAPGKDSGSRGLYWASLGDANPSYAWNMTFGNTTDYLCMRSDSEGRYNGRPIRLFRDN